MCGGLRRCAGGFAPVMYYTSHVTSVCTLTMCPAVVSSTMMRGSTCVVLCEREEGGGGEKGPRGQDGRQAGREGKRGRSREGERQAEMKKEA